MTLMKRSSSTAVCAAFFVIAFAVLAGSGVPASAQVENNTNRPGMDYRSFLMSPNASPQQCQLVCKRELGRGCRAWTFVKVGIQDPTCPRCWLKTAPVPRAVRDRCCVSGREVVID